jgi:hypothetical protein
MVFRSLVLSALWFGFAAWGLHQVSGHAVGIPQPAPRSAVEISNASPVLRCELAGTMVNRFIAEIQARGALSEGPFDKTPFEIYSLKEIDGGFLVSLGPSQHAGSVMLGGGGLVWVDAETGCVSVLRLYQ